MCDMIDEGLILEVLGADGLGASSLAKGPKQ